MFATTAPRPFLRDRHPDRVSFDLRRVVPRPLRPLVPRPLLAPRLSPGTPVRRRPPRVALAGTFAEEFPAAPNPSAGGMTSRRVPPTRMPGTPSLQNSSVDGFASWRGLAGWFAPRVVMICFPVESQTVNWTFTARGGRGSSPAADADVGVLEALQPGVERGRGGEGIRGRDRTRRGAIGRYRGDVAADGHGAATRGERQNRQRGPGHSARETRAQSAEVVRHRRRIVPRRRVQSN